jgi:8-oxo-dGTP pyrophosphatase MutT (NUDIX family)
MENKEKIYLGGIALLYTRENGGLKFLVVENAETKNITFVSGAKEDSDSSETDTMYRELKEELGLNYSDVDLDTTDIKQEFIFGPKKKERAGHKGSYTVFMGDATKISSNISYTKELSGIKWMTKEEVLNRLTFPDLKEIFLKATENLN